MQKIPTIFKRDYSQTFQVLPEPNPVCQWVFNSEGVPYRKWQGQSAMIQNGAYYKRSIIKPKQRLPSGFILCTYDIQSNKKFGWVQVDNENPQDKYYIEAYDPELPDGTYELIGPKILGNHENVDSQQLIPHDAQLLFIPDLTYKGIKYFLTHNPFEGIVFHHPDGRMAKIKQKDYGMVR